SLEILTGSGIKTMLRMGDTLTGRRILVCTSDQNRYIPSGFFKNRADRSCTVGSPRHRSSRVIFTSFSYLYLLVVVLALYWTVRNRTLQNLLLLISSYLFYGWIHPWFCFLIASSTLIDYLCGLGMEKHSRLKKRFLIVSLVSNLGLLGTFKYFNFFTDNAYQVLTALGFHPHTMSLRIFLPVGISFYTFQTLSYTIDIYRGKLKPRRNLLDFAVFVSFFPQLVAGPIERAVRFLPQVERPRFLSMRQVEEAWPLLVRGYLKKLVIADNAAVYADKVFMYAHPSLPLLTAGTLAFTLQILSDFSAYTDIARGSAKLLGFELIENFRSPYLAISPSDFWRRWHISFSTWIRDYLYIPLGGSRVATFGRYAFVVAATMTLSGLWHGAAWNFIIWGFYHGVLLLAYHRLGLAGRWRPSTFWTAAVAWAAMFFFTIFGWLIFRAPDLSWLMDCLTHLSWQFGEASFLVSLQICLFILFYSIPLLLFLYLDRRLPAKKWIHSIAYGLCLFAIVLLFQEAGQDFIYFQF
ncbi:MAG: MBOAT family O-acyltransferase, partial [Acidobacteriota bacterium]